MDIGEIILEHSPWWILISLLLGGFYAFLLYSSKSPWSGKQNLLLAGLRFLTIMIISVLLLEPQIKKLHKTYEKPIAIIGLDNSASVAMSSKYDSAALKKEVSNLVSGLQSHDFEVQLKNLESNTVDELNGFNFNQKKTSIGNFISETKVSSEGTNHAFTVLLSDGINNSGRSPSYITSTAPVYTSGLGDTARLKDVILRPLKYNKVTYEGNKFKINAEIANIGYQGKKLTISLKYKGKVLERKSIQFTKSDQILRVSFVVANATEGNQKYSVVVSSLEDEVTKRNNIQHAYLDVIKGQQKILIAASAPHPDIKALQSVINKNRNYETVLYVEGINKLNLKSQYDLVICHQCFPKRRSKLDQVVTWMNKNEVSVIHILGDNFFPLKANKQLKFLQKKPQRSIKDEVSGSYNNSFSKFQFDRGKQSVFNNLPPISVPYGQWKVSGTSEILLYQQIGSVTTEQPLLLVNERNERKQAVFTGSGLWIWRMHEKALDVKESSTELLISKLIQYVSTKNDKRRLRVYSNKKEYFDDEKVIINSELYNESYEPIFNIPVTLAVSNTKNETKSYSYTPTEINSSLSLSDLAPDAYSFTAKAILGQKEHKAFGQFTIKELDIEALDLQANHQLLRRLSKTSGGSFYKLDETPNLLKKLIDSKPPSIIHTHEEFEPLIKNWIILLLVALLIGTEWFLRKYWGKY